jgi:sterol desaturase/sphingolipid hydroxylase (fatty acid hydroxylase superfamily)
VGPRELKAFEARANLEGAHVKWGWAQTWIVVLAAGALTLTIVELVWEWRVTRTIGAIFERLGNWSSLFVGELVRAVTLPLKLVLFTWVGSHALVTMHAAWWVFPCCYVLTDFLYYVTHYFLHTTRIGWAFHSVHHTAPTFDLSVPYRLSWVARIFDDLFYLPLVVIGFPPTMVLFAIILNLFSQIWIHTEMVGTLGPLDLVLNTPSNHRVHHHARRGGLRSNYGGNFMIWDHLFGTYEKERERKPYGADLGDLGPNPIRVQLEGFRRLFAGTLIVGESGEKNQIG